MSYGNYVQGNIDTTDNSYNLLISGASSGYAQSALSIGGDTNTVYGLKLNKDASNNVTMDMRADPSNRMSFRYRDNTTGTISSMLQLANDTSLTGNGYGAIVQGRMNAASYFVSGVDTRAPVTPGMYFSNDGNVGQFRINKGTGTGGFSFSTFSSNGTLLQSNLNLLASGMIQAAYYTATGAAADFESVAAAGFDASGNLIRNFALNTRLRTLEARVTVVELANVPTLTTKMNEMITRLNGLNFFSQNISTIATYGISNSPPVNVNPTPIQWTITPKSGDWFQVQFPSAFIATRMTIQTRFNLSNRSASSIVVAGSNDGYNWYSVSNNTGIIYNNGTPTFITMNGTSPASYSYYRIIAIQLTAQPSSLWELSSFSMNAGSQVWPPLKLSSQTVSGQSYGNGVYNITSNQSLTASLGGNITVQNLYGVLGNPFPDTSGGYPILSVSTQSYLANAGTYSGGAATNVNYS